MTEAVSLVKAYFIQLQSDLCQALEALDAKAAFETDPWSKPAGGEGITRVIRDGGVFESGGVNFSHVYGKALPAAATVKRPQLVGHAFEALGLSLVLHPYNPYVPTTHCNLRFFSAKRGHEPPIWWFGGGWDLTPYYGFVEDCVHWHRVAKSACDPFGDALYARFKAQCDAYFYLPHRAEHRGIGGLFFDDWNTGGFDQSFDLVRRVGAHFSLAYLPLVRRRHTQPFGARERAFQAYRRGRYVEFNLLYDRGTRFGLEFGGRVESILLSLPRQVAWQYCYAPEPETPEAALVETFLTPKDWLAM